MFNNVYHGLYIIPKLCVKILLISPYNNKSQTIRSKKNQVIQNY